MSARMEQLQADAAARFRAAVKRRAQAEPCGRALATVRAAWEDEPQETTSESTPGQRCSNTYPGPRRPIGDDRLMSTISTLNGGAPAVCPNCGHSAVAEDVRANDNMRTGNYCCTAGHIWTTRWLVAA